MKSEFRNDVGFATVYRRIYCRKIDDVIQSDVSFAFSSALESVIIAFWKVNLNFIIHLA